MMEVMLALVKLSGELKEIKEYLRYSYKTRFDKFTEAWIDGQDVMQSLHISKRTLQSLRDNGTLPYSRINGKFYYKLSDIERMLESNYSTFKNLNNEDK